MMDIDEALEVLGIELQEGQTISVVALSRSYARKNAACNDDKEREKIAEAFDYLKTHIMQLQDMTKEDKLKDLFPVMVGSRNRNWLSQSIDPTLVLHIDGVPEEVTFNKFNGNEFLIIPTADLQLYDTIVTYWNGAMFDSNVIVRDITSEEYERMS